MNSDHKDSEKPAEGRVGRKRFGDDSGQRVGDRVGIDRQDVQGGDDIGEAHERHDSSGNRPDAFDAPDDHDTDQSRHHDPVNVRIVLEETQIFVAANRFQRLADLKGIAATKTGADAKQHEQHGKDLAERSQPDIGETEFQITHRPAENTSVLVAGAVKLAECAFGEFGRHPEQSDQDDPKGRPRPAGADRDRHARDIS